MASDSVIVELGDRSYPITFGDLDDIGTTFKNQVEKVSKAIVVSNDKVGPLHSKQVLASLSKAGFTTQYLEIPDGESHKDTTTFITLLNQLLDFQVDRKSLLVALGGGVTTDIVGFAAATILRGIKFANIPTSLLAMVDASVGGKTGVNSKHGKNLIGAFWQPEIVYIPIESLKTLDDAELRCGLGEVVKHAVLEQTLDLKPTSEFFEWLEKNGHLLIKRDNDALKHAIKRCCEIKALIVSADERESGKRALLNLGHTVGHAIEHVLGYGNLRHGEAVGIGTLAEAQLGVSRGVTSKDLVLRIYKLLKVCGLPTHYENLSVADLSAAVMMDKKREDTVISVTIPYAIGDVRLEKLSVQDLTVAFESVDTNKALEQQCKS